MRGNTLRFAESNSGAHGGRHPLLAAQEAVWRAQRLDPDGPAHSAAVCVHIGGAVDPALFGQALRHTVAEVEALHVRFGVDGEGRPWRSPVPGAEWQPHVADLTAAADPERSARAWMARDLARPVDLAHGPLFRHALLRTAAERYLWYHRVHRIALDEAGLARVALRVAQVYTALAKGAPPGAGDFAAPGSVFREEREYEESGDIAADRAYWTGRFADRPVPAAPARRPALPVRGVLRRTTDLGPADLRALRAAARTLSTPWPTVLLAATAAYVQRSTGEGDVVLGVPAGCSPGTTGGTLPLRVGVSGGDSLRDLAVRLSDEWRAALPHQRYPADRLRRDLGLAGGGRRLFWPRVTVLPFEESRFGGHPGRIEYLSAGPVDDLSVLVHAVEDGAALRIVVQADASLYDAAWTAAHLRGLAALLREAVAAPDRALGASYGVRRQASARPLLSLVADHAARRGGATAVAHGRQRITYAELFGAARHLARRLAARDIGPGSTVGVALPRGIDAVTAFLGVLMSGAACCPFDPAAPPSRTAALLDAAAPALVLTDSDHARSFAGRPVLPVAPSDSDAQAPVRAARDAAAPACVLYTPAQAGPPAREEISHGLLAALAANAPCPWPANSAAGADITESLLALSSGVTLVVPADDATGSVPPRADAPWAATARPGSCGAGRP